MILLVLLHKGRGGGLSDMFGGGVSSGLGGSSVAERNLDRITIGIGAGVVRVRGRARAAAQDRQLSSTSNDLEGDHRGRRRKRHPGQPGRRRPHGRGGARRRRPAPERHLLLLPRAPHADRVRGRGAVPDTWDCPRCGLPASLDSRQPAAGAEDRALQDPPGLREGAPLRRRGQGHPRRGHPDPPPPPQERRHHLLVRRPGAR